MVAGSALVQVGHPPQGEGVAGSIGGVGLDDDGVLQGVRVANSVPGCNGAGFGDCDFRVVDDL